MFWRLIVNLKGFSVSRASSTQIGHSNLLDLAYCSTALLGLPLLIAMKTTGLSAKLVRS
jgi:hypothetical protein